MTDHPGQHPTRTTVPAATIRGFSRRAQGIHHGKTRVPPDGHLTTGQNDPHGAVVGQPPSREHSAAGQTPPTRLTAAEAGGVDRAGG